MNNEFLLRDRIQKIQQIINQYGEENFSISFSEGGGLTMANKRPTQRQRIVEYMRKNGSIDRLDSCTKLFIFELSSRIGELEDRGWRFEKTWKTVKNTFGESKSFVVYKIIKEGTEV